VRIARAAATHFESDFGHEKGWSVMRMIRLHVLALSALALLTFPGTGHSQTATANPNLLPSKQVRELVANAKTSDDHAKLARHFLALAEQYEADAADHKAFAEAYRKAPTASETKRPGGPDTAAHCDRFAKLAADAAKEARALAAAHERMAKH